LFTFRADRCFRSSHAPPLRTRGSHHSHEAFHRVSSVCVDVGEPIADGIESNG
jgi:hypothetical protein